MKKIISCEVCENTNIHQVLDLGNHPLCDDLIPIGENIKNKEYPLEISYCENCYTAHQTYQVPKEKLFPKNYHYRARFTKDVLNGMKNFTFSCENEIGSLTDKKVLDIGCNDGSLLNFFKEKKSITIGVEPTDAHKDAKEKGHIVYGNYFTENIAKEILEKHGKPDIITFTNVFAHIENLNELLSSLSLLFGEHTTLVIENHYLGSLLGKLKYTQEA